MIQLTDARIPVSPPDDGIETVILWRVTGIHQTMWPTKIAAEAAARQRFPEEDEDTRYARIFYSEFHRELNL